MELATGTRWGCGGHSGGRRSRGNGSKEGLTAIKRDVINGNITGKTITNLSFEDELQIYEILLVIII